MFNQLMAIVTQLQTAVSQLQKDVAAIKDAIAHKGVTDKLIN